MSKLQIVVDTNVLIAALRSKRGAASLFLLRLNDDRWIINVSTALLLEYEEVLKRPDMRPFISAGEADELIDAICSIAKDHDIFYLWRLLVRDPEDAFIFELAVSANADFLITFNTKDFLKAVDFGVKLVTPREFLDFVGDLS